jgi:hypothetical protein
MSFTQQALTVLVNSGAPLMHPNQKHGEKNTLEDAILY